jgi:hypothetical protein
LAIFGKAKNADDDTKSEHRWKPHRKALREQVLAGRTSVDEDRSAVTNLGWLKDQYASLALKLPWELYDYVEILAKYNPDYSQAVNNVVSLGNPGYKILVDAKSPGAVANLQARIADKEQNLNPRIGGFNGIFSKLLDSAATYGAMCGEWVLDEKFKDVTKFVFINPKSVRFFWNEVEDDWHPFQKVNRMEVERAKARGQNTVGEDYIELNTMTFNYQTVFSMHNNPYGIPPYFAALEALAIQRQMINNLKSIIQKLGLVGILELSVRSLEQNPFETEDEYQARCQTFLQSYTNILEDVMNKGGLIHFDDTEITNLSISDKAGGADKIFKMNEEQVFSGLHSLPAIQGRTYSTTETYAGVAYELILRNIATMTNASKHILERGLWLMTNVWNVPATKVVFKPLENKTLHRLQNAQAEMFELQTDMALWLNGILDQKGVAQRHNIDIPAREIETPVVDTMKFLLTDELQKVFSDVYDRARQVSAALPTGHSHDKSAAEIHEQIKRETQSYHEDLAKYFERVQDIAREVCLEVIDEHT